MALCSSLKSCPSSTKDWQGNPLQIHKTYWNIINANFFLRVDSSIITNILLFMYLFHSPKFSHFGADTIWNVWTAFVECKILLKVHVIEILQIYFGFKIVKRLDFLSLLCMLSEIFFEVIPFSWARVFTRMYNTCSVFGKSQVQISAHRSAIPRIFMVFLSLSRKMPRQYLKISHDHSHAKPFQLIIHLSPLHLTMNTLNH
jgi:hypothetical protein